MSFPQHTFQFFMTCALLGYSVQAWAAPSSTSLEDEMFGGDQPTQSNTPAISPKAQSAELPAPPPSADKGSETLTLGGRLELGSILNKSATQNIGDATLNQTTSAELYLDSRPNDSLRGFIKGALSHKPTTTSSASTTDIALYEMWIKWGGESAVYTTLGRQKLKWGAATFWNPTDFLSVQPKDPLASFDVRPGANLVKFHLPVEKSGHNFYLILDIENASTASSPRAAGRAEFNYGFGDWTGELTATLVGGKDQPNRFGLDLSTALGPVDLVVESAWTRRSKQKFYDKTFSDAGALSFTEKSRADEAIPQVVTGLRYDFKYSDSDSANFNVEYFWNGAGYADVAREAYSFVQGQAQRLYLANRYAAASLFLNQPGSLNDSSFLLTALTNLTDKSWLVRGSVTQRIATRSRLECAVNKAIGAGEFTGGIPVSVANELKASSGLPKTASDALDRVSGFKQDLTISVTAGIDL